RPEFALEFVDNPHKETNADEKNHQFGEGEGKEIHRFFHHGYPILKIHL
ncbi:unnamed protein product, partial [marine sediment metagenome]